jgi:hypothetical protein
MPGNRQKRDRINAKLDLLGEAAVEFFKSDRSDAGPLFAAADAYAREREPEPKKMTEKMMAVHGMPENDMRETFCGLDVESLGPLSSVPYSHPVLYREVTCGTCRRVIRARGT